MGDAAQGRASRAASLLGTAVAVGLPNLARAFSYRVRLRYAVHPVCRARAVLPQGPYFADPQGLARSADGLQLALPPLKLFGWLGAPTDTTCPQWHASAVTGKQRGGNDLPWWRIPDFCAEFGDIKEVWELSRFGWIGAFATAARTGSPAGLERLNTWLADWCASNPAYCGVNWKCGQEAAIRVLHLAVAALLLGEQGRPTPALRNLVAAHLQRIEPTMAYAVTQDNNHGTSEAAALWVGGTWLASSGPGSGTRWARVGRRWLENRVARLIGADGSFSQYSLNYHRMVLDTLSMVEVWRQRLRLPSFSAVLYERAAAAAEWLHAVVDARTGDAPNLGANDGAHLLHLTDTDYRDYRPSVQLAAALFCHARAYQKQLACDAQLAWFGIDSPEAAEPEPRSALFDDGGYAVLRSGGAMCVVRYPRFRFRPSHADGLHVDLWVHGENLLRDGGSYSYATEPPWDSYFPGTRSHNTIEFDGRDQMPRLSRFLYGNWLRTRERSAVEEDVGFVSFSAAYADSWGATHQRQVSLETGRLVVRDSISGFRESAVLRWRLVPGQWAVDGTSVTGAVGRVSVLADMPFVRFELVGGWESRYYLQRTELPVLEVEVREPGTLRTEFSWVA